MEAGRRIESVRSADIVSGGTLVSHDCYARVFCGRVRVLDSERSQGNGLRFSTKVPNTVGKFLRNQNTHKNNGER